MPSPFHCKPFFCTEKCFGASPSQKSAPMKGPNDHRHVCACRLGRLSGLKCSLALAKALALLCSKPLRTLHQTRSRDVQANKADQGCIMIAHVVKFKCMQECCEEGGEDGATMSGNSFGLEYLDKKEAGWG